MELSAYCSCLNLKKPLEFWWPSDNYEVDFIINNRVAIEGKSSTKISKAI
jgi:hypothetical protein